MYELDSQGDRNMKRILTRSDLQRLVNRLKAENQQLQARLEKIADIVDEENEDNELDSYEEDYPEEDEEE
jgi:hypothetical protein